MSAFFPFVGSRPTERAPSTSRSTPAVPPTAVPATIIRCVGPQRVTSCPNVRCHRSSSGKAAKPNAPPASSRTPPAGSGQRPLILRATGLERSGFFGAMPTARRPIWKTPNRPMSSG
ncbi:unannotated protein [freshwater metagenome]|uniref:Unannotated protein n=1 Tax=freshwater metagenome TaxID=449393 RepID=A0A6J7IX94_9ZZZZ